MSISRNFTATGTWLCPPGCSTVTVECWGGGGGGSGDNNTGASRAGGGGAYSKANAVAVVPGTIYTVTVGAGGPGGGGAPTNGTAGGDTWFSTSGTVLAKGGAGGVHAGAAGAGGAAGSGIGDVKFSGGNGGSVSPFRGGGGGAGDAADGSPGLGSTGGAGGSAGGGAGGNTSLPGNILSGGGGGSSFSVGSGGAGARGKVQLTYADTFDIWSSATKLGNTNADITNTFSADGPTTPNASNAPSPGDLYIVAVEASVFTAGTTPAFATPTGFTVGPTSIAASGLRNGLATFWKIMDGTETSIAITATPNSANAGMVAVILRFMAGTFDTTLLSQATAAQTATANTISIAGLTTSMKEAYVLYIHGSASASSKTSAPPSDVSEYIDVTTDPGDAADLSIGAMIQLVPGATGAKVFTVAAGGLALNSGVCIALQRYSSQGWGEIPIS